jgi:hypothetical protein
VNWFKHRVYWMVAGVIFVLPIMAQGQTSIGSVTMKANVSETVALSVSPNLLQGNVQVDGHSDVKSLTLTVSGPANEVVSVRVPILIRSNTGYKISGLVQSQAATLANFAVLDAQPTGRFVAADGLANLQVAPELDSRNKNAMVQMASVHLNHSSPLRILSGPRVSLAGTLNSADNALEVILLIVVKPDVGADGWSLRLTLSGSAGDQF